MMAAATLVVVEVLTSAHMETPMVAAGVAVVAAMVPAVVLASRARNIVPLLHLLPPCLRM